MKDFKPDLTPISRSTSSLILQKMGVLNIGAPSRRGGRYLLLLLLLGGTFAGGYYFSKRQKGTPSVSPQIPVASSVVMATNAEPVVAAPVALPVATPVAASQPLVNHPTPSSLAAVPVGDPSVTGSNATIRVVRYGPVDKKRIALTFDDGPQANVTPKVLEVLKEHGVKATFFVLGDRVKQHPEILRMIVNDGHEIGNHTYSHRLLTAMTTNLIEREVYETQELIRQSAGVETHMFRPPYGAYRNSTKQILQEAGLMNIVLWSVDPEDWHVRNSQHIVDAVTNRVQSGAIIVCHDIYKSTLNALPDMITSLKGMGYELVTVNELCGVPSSTPVGATAPAAQGPAPAATPLPSASPAGTTPISSTNTPSVPAQPVILP